MITNYESFINTPNLLELSEGMQAKFGIKEFSGLFGGSLFESETDNMLLEKVYGTYELGLLYENRKSWFENNDPIYMLEGDEHKVLFKENSMFILSNSSYAILNEQLEDAWDWMSDQANSVIKRTSDSAKAAVAAVASASKETWDALSDGAKKVYEFGKRIVSAAAEFAKADPLEAWSIGLKILSVLTSFFPPAGIWLSPICLAASGGIDIYEGIHKIRESYSKLKMMDVSNPKRSAESFAVGGPLLISGLISLGFGINDLITAPTAGTGIGPIASMGGRKVATAWGKSYVGTAIKGFEHAAEHNMGKIITKLGPKLSPGFGKFIAERVTGDAPALISMYLTTVGKHIFGTTWNLIVRGLSEISKAFSFLLGVPTKIGDAIKNFKKSAETPGAKIISSALDSFVGPAMRGMGSFIDLHMKPNIDGLSAWLNSIEVNYKDLEKLAESEEISGEKIEIKNKQIKPKNAVVQKSDEKSIKKLPEITAGVKEGLNHIRGFDEFSIV